MLVNGHKLIELEEGWDCLQKGIMKLKNLLEGHQESSFTPEEYTLPYTTVYRMCTQMPPHDYSQHLYDRYREIFKDYITTRVMPSLEEKHDEFMLRELVRRWANHKVMIRWLYYFFRYLDRYFIARKSLPTLKEVGIVTFRDSVYKELNGKVRDVVISLINQEREGTQIDRALLKNVLDIFVEIGMGKMDYYENDFEAAMLSNTADYYSRKASSWIMEDSCPDYMFKAEKYIKQEKDRISHYLPSSSEVKLLDKAQHELLTVHSAQLLENEHTGCNALLTYDKVDDLSRMYRLFSKVLHGLDPIYTIFKQHIAGKGTVLVKQAEDAATNKKAEKKGVVDSPEQVFISKVIELHDKYLQYVNECFQNHSLFHQALKEAFEVLVGKGVGGSSSAEIVATFCNNILQKGGNEKLIDEAIEEKLEKAVKLLVYTSDKDLFAEFYRRKLSRRLLQGRSAKEEHERSAISKMKLQFGSQFTSKMEGMVNDLALANNNQNDFEDYLAENEEVKPGIDLQVTVLTANCWPSYKPIDINLPEELAKCIEVYTTYYQTKTKYRKLTWMYSMGTCTIVGKFQPTPIEMILATYQAVVLLLFNNSDRLSFSEIVSQLNLTNDDAVRLLHSLSCAKYKILLKDPSTNTISHTDTFEFNSKFTSRMRTIRVPLPPLDDKKKVIEDIDKDRRYAVDAAIVRIMKSRRVLGHQQLVTECGEQLARMFKPDLRLIKRRIEGLISKDYLARDEENSNSYTYLA